MSIVSEIKCARCDRKYSGVRSRCPYCGARRIGRGKYSEDSDNSRGKMLISVLLLGVLVIAAGFLLLTTPPPEPEVQGPVVSNTITVPDESDNVTVTNSNTPPPSTPPPVVEETPPPPTPPQVRSVIITYAGRENKDFTAAVAEKVPLVAKVEPPGLDEEIIWTSSNRNVFEVVETSLDGTTATVTGVGKGTATLTVTVGGVEATCVVRVN